MIFGVRGEANVSGAWWRGAVLAGWGAFSTGPMVKGLLDGGEAAIEMREKIDHEGIKLRDCLGSGGWER